MGFTGIAAGLGQESANAGKAQSQQLAERIAQLRASLAQRQTAVSEGDLGVQQQYAATNQEYADLAQRRALAVEQLMAQGEIMKDSIVYSPDGKKVTALLWKNGHLIPLSADVPFGKQTGQLKMAMDRDAAFKYFKSRGYSDDQILELLNEKPTKADPYADWKAAMARGDFKTANEIMQYHRQPKDTSAANAMRAAAREDKSYQYHNSAIDRLANPLDQMTQRLARVEDSLAQGTPQADALVAPELLSVMAGGQGSGVRMNEAEIARIVGGRNNWETLKSKAMAWQADPNKGFLLTPAQRMQTRALFDAVQRRAEEKQQLIEDARKQLASSSDPLNDRAIYANLRNELFKIDRPYIYARDPQGKLHRAHAGTPLPKGWKVQQ
jgi:hypothetical protein